jgi:hypothetical protein
MSSATVMAGSVDEDPPHGLGGDAKEVAMIGIRPVADESKVGLVHQCCRLKKSVGWDESRGTPG